jgi:hypothetical protein
MRESILSLLYGLSLLGLALCGLALLGGLLAFLKRQTPERSNQAFIVWAWTPLLGTALVLVSQIAAALTFADSSVLAVAQAIGSSLLTLTCWGCLFRGVHLNPRAPRAANGFFSVSYLSAVGVGLLPFLLSFFLSLARITW